MMALILISKAISHRALVKRLIKQNFNLFTLIKAYLSSSAAPSAYATWYATSSSRRCSFNSTVETCTPSLVFYRPVTSYSTSTSHRCSTPTHDDSDRKLQCVLDYWTGQLQSKNIDEPDISTNYIVAHVLGHKTIHDVDSNTILTKSQEEKIQELCQLRLTSMPVQYVIGEWDFMNLTLKMKPPVLIPRPETEELAGLCIETLLQDTDAQLGTILEIGCGSGALSLALLHKFPKLHVVAVDISEDACSLTSENAQRLGLKERTQIIHGDFCSEKVLNELGKLSPFPLIVSNPPYLSTNEIENLQPEIKCFEDHAALDGGHDGLDIVREIILKSVYLLKDDGHVWLEVSHQHPPQISHFVQENPHCSLSLTRVVRDLFGKERFCQLQKKSFKKR